MNKKINDNTCENSSLNLNINDENDVEFNEEKSFTVEGRITAPLPRPPHRVQTMMEENAIPAENENNIHSTCGKSMNTSFLSVNMVDTKPENNSRRLHSAVELIDDNSEKMMNVKSDVNGDSAEIDESESYDDGGGDDGENIGILDY